VTAPTPFESQGLGKFQFYRCPERKILLKIEIQMAVKLYLYFGLENQRTIKRVTFEGDGSLFLFSTYHRRRQIKKLGVTNYHLISVIFRLMDFAVFCCILLYFNTV
jgi:hypothetical protein